MNLRKKLSPALVLATTVVMVACVGAALAAQSPSGGEATSSGHKHRGKRGPRGPRGPGGPPGLPGPAGAPGANGAGIPLIFKAQSPTSNTRIFEGAGLLINASCNSGPATSLTGVSEVNGSVLRATDVVSGAIVKVNSTTINQQFTLTPGGAENNYVLTYLSGNGSNIITADYGIANGGMSLVNVSCAVFGTIQAASG